MWNACFPNREKGGTVGTVVPDPKPLANRPHSAKAHKCQPSLQAQFKGHEAQFKGNEAQFKGQAQISSRRGNCAPGSHFSRLTSLLNSVVGWLPLIPGDVPYEGGELFKRKNESLQARFTPPSPSDLGGNHPCSMKSGSPSSPI